MLLEIYLKCLSIHYNPKQILCKKIKVEHLLQLDLGIYSEYITT